MMSWMEHNALFSSISKRVEELLLTRNGLFPLEKFKTLYSFVRRVIEGDVVVEFSSLARIFTLVIYFHGHNSFEETKKVGCGLLTELEIASETRQTFVSEPGFTSCNS